ncbi:hypothetical protein L218DRAFT_737475 [Marasmius fiardii PR-910]|nr:hypothetical protein L218DRAFT_737475 [Marasmius fiardii PR-910]
MGVWQLDREQVAAGIGLRTGLVLKGLGIYLNCFFYSRLSSRLVHNELTAPAKRRCAVIPTLVDWVG